MQAMKFFIDTHDQRSQTFPDAISAQEFSQFFAKYEQACREEGVVVLRAHVGLSDGRAYCFNMAPSAEHVRRAHERAGLPFESITEVQTATPGDLFFDARI
ncbi:MAG: DUF4242 domain-containing protein [Myxococcota bacterium]